MEEKIEEEKMVFESAEDLEKKRKREVIFELVLFFVLGVLIGITVKTEAVKRITIGFSDYKITSVKNTYKIEEMKKNLEQQAAAIEAAQQVQQGQANNQADSNQLQQ